MTHWKKCPCGMFWCWSFPRSLVRSKNYFKERNWDDELIRMLVNQCPIWGFGHYAVHRCRCLVFVDGGIFNVWQSSIKFCLPRQMLLLKTLGYTLLSYLLWFVTTAMQSWSISKLSQRRYIEAPLRVVVLCHHLK